MPYVTTWQYQKIFWENGSLTIEANYGSEYRKAGVLHLAVISLTTDKHDFYMKLIVVLL